MVYNYFFSFRNLTYNYTYVYLPDYIFYELNSMCYSYAPP